MPVIDVYAPEGLFPANKERDLAVSLMMTALRAEGFPNPSAEIRDVVGTFFHHLPIHTANTAQARVVRIQITASAGGFNRAGTQLFIPEATRLVAEAAGDPSQAERTWIYITETISTGLGLGGVVIGMDEARAGEKSRS